MVNRRRRFIHSLYADAFIGHLPVYISADSILFAVHKSFAAVLKILESTQLRVDLDTVLGSMRARLAAGALGRASADVRADVDAYLAVAASLLDGNSKAPVAGAPAEAVTAIVTQATSGDGATEVKLFGESRTVDFSQFKPRGHYAGSVELSRYFRAMMWLSRTDLRAVDVRPNGKQVFQRRQLDVAFALRELLDAKGRQAWARIDGTSSAFVGEPDEMTLRDLDTLLRELGAKDLTALASVSDDTILATLTRTGLGHSRIASQIVEHGAGVERALPLATSFALVNQRYTLDAHVLANVVHDRVPARRPKGRMRMMPDPLDVAFAALGNDGAAYHLRGELDQFGYAPELHMMRVLADAHGDDYWQANLYTTWSSALRALSPSATALVELQKGGLPSVAATRAWNDRILSTQLASWADLRHDTVLYAKQSHSSGIECEFPDAYVDPYPEFFDRIALHARVGKRLAASVLAKGNPAEPSVRAYFEKLEEVARTLGEMARSERAGAPFTKAQMEFINEMINVKRNGCGGPLTFTGWYGDLFVDRSNLEAFDPTITDVHTQPTDEAGSKVGRVLHVGTGYANGIVVTVDSCQGPRAYAGYVSSYYQTVTSGFERLDDAVWSKKLYGPPIPAPPWLAPIVPR